MRRMLSVVAVIFWMLLFTNISWSASYTVLTPQIGEATESNSVVTNSDGSKTVKTAQTTFETTQKIVHVAGVYTKDACQLKTEIWREGKDTTTPWWTKSADAVSAKSSEGYYYVVTYQSDLSKVAGYTLKFRTLIDVQDGNGFKEISNAECSINGTKTTTKTTEILNAQIGDGSSSTSITTNKDGSKDINTKTPYFNPTGRIVHLAGVKTNETGQLVTEIRRVGIDTEETPWWSKEVDPVSATDTAAYYYIATYQGNLDKLQGVKLEFRTLLDKSDGKGFQTISTSYAVVGDGTGKYPLQNWFGFTGEDPRVGDFNGDGITDIITFSRENPNAMGDVYVALSDGTFFGDAEKWNDWFGVNKDETIVIGDFDGDGISDIATWLGKSTKQVYVSTSYGSGMNEGTVWLDNLGGNDGTSDCILKTGDVNGDKVDDLVLFQRSTGKVYVALSNGMGFDTSRAWNSWFAVSTHERPEVGDVNGDGKADIITFCTDSPTAQGDVYVALSDGKRFGNSDKWADWFSVDPSQKIRIADVNGDGKADFVTFLADGQVYVVYSQGNSMSENHLLAETFIEKDGDLPFLGDVNGDGKADLILFRQSEGKVYVQFN